MTDRSTLAHPRDRITALPNTPTTPCSTHPYWEGPLS